MNNIDAAAVIVLGYYGSGIIRTIVNVYYEYNREMHKRLWKDGATEIQSDFRRVLWLLCMSRKTEAKAPKGRKSTEAASGTAVEDVEDSNMTDQDINDIYSATSGTSSVSIYICINNQPISLLKTMNTHY